MTENTVLRLKIIKDTLIRRSYENNDRNLGSRQFSLWVKIQFAFIFLIWWNAMKSVWF